MSTLSSLLLAASTIVAQAEAPAAPTTVAQAEAPAAPAVSEQYRQLSLGAVLNFGLGSSISGFHLVGQLGVQSLGLRSYNQRWLVQWDALIAVRMGELANARPYTFFAGGGGRGNVEVDYRIWQKPWSPYAGARLAGNLQVMAPPGTALDRLNTINNSDGFGGITADGAIRLAGGMSYLQGHRSVLAFLFFQERLRTSAIVAQSAAFSELGIGARFDMFQSFTGQLEGTVGSTRSVGNGALHLTNQIIRYEAGGEVRKWFASGLWIGLAASYSIESDRIVYLQSNTSFATVSAPVFTATAALGFAFSRKP